MGNDVLTKRWTTLDYHAVQNALWKCDRRFIVVPAGRRSGKTELAKRNIVLKALSFTDAPDGRFVCAAPTHAQAKEIFWADLKSLVPKWALETPLRPKNSISESNLSIKLCNGAKLQVCGLDKPERIEGSPLDGIVLDEYGNMKPTAWTEHVRPALSTPGRSGWCWFIGVPEGRNHYYFLWKKAIKDASRLWSGFTWNTAEINPAEAAIAKDDMDTLTYQQEYEGAFVSFEGLAYYAFNRMHNCPPVGESINYIPGNNLVFAFDFNRTPGVAAVMQEQPAPRWLNEINGRKLDTVTAMIDEVWIQKGSNTEVVCDRLISRWGNIHKEGRILVYGDATGGAKTSQAVAGSDWDIIKKKLTPVFKGQCVYKYGRSNPPVRVRLNDTNSRFHSATGLSRFIVDPTKCEHTVYDLEGVQCKDDGSIDKTSDPLLTHISDAIGYYINTRFGLKNKLTQH